MKKISILACGLALLTACSENDALTGSQMLNEEMATIFLESTDLEVGVIDAELRTSFGYADGGNYKWVADDEVGAVFINNNNGNINQTRLTCTNGGSLITNGKFEFTGNLRKETDYRFYYPYNVNNKALTTDGITFTMPATQIQYENKGQNNFAACGFMYSSTISYDEVQRGEITMSTEMELRNAAAIFHLKVSLPEGTVLNYVELVGNGIEFPQTASLAFDAEKPTYSNPLNSICLYTGSNGFEFVTGDELYEGYLLTFPTDKSGTIDFRLHTNKGIYAINKTLSSGTKSNTRYRVALTGAEGLSAPSPWEGVEDYSTPRIEEKTISIYNAAHLSWISAISAGTITDDRIANKNFNGYSINLMGDIDLNGKEWAPIASSSNFAGEFNGNGKTISGLVTNGAGLFTKIAPAGYISNLTISNPNINADVANVAAIVGANNGTVDNCTVIGGNITSTKNNVGAIAGNNSGTISNCTVDESTITGSNNVGGIAGNNNNGSVIGCSVSIGTTITTTTTNNNPQFGNIVGTGNSAE